MTIMENDCRQFAAHLQSEERGPDTICKYLRDLRRFAVWLNGRELSKELVFAWRDHLLGCGYAPATINSMLSAVNRFFKFTGRTDCRVRFLRVQRRTFREESRDLTKNDYQKLLDAAQSRGQARLALLMEAICSTGIRVSEARYVTVEAARLGRADIRLKGKIRTILLPSKLCRKLLKYAKKQKIASGEIFLTRSGKSLSRRQIWREMKDLCEKAGVESSKVFPHNLRHLFALSFYKACKDVVMLADILGHSSINTTRIYLITTGTEHARQLEKLHLIT